MAHQSVKGKVASVAFSGEIIRFPKKRKRGASANIEEANFGDKKSLVLLVPLSQSC